MEGYGVSEVEKML